MDESPCTDEARRAFDFWIGAWEVRGPAGRLAGHNRITSLFDGCALKEEWEGVSGHRGTSLNAYAPATGRWHQTWVDASGELLLLDGGMVDGAMVLEGSTGRTRHRISWSLIEGDADQLRQHWETSEDGEEWATAFDGRYIRMR
jgi:hypothetical protein